MTEEPSSEVFGGSISAKGDACTGLTKCKSPLLIPGFSSFDGAGSYRGFVSLRKGAEEPTRKTAMKYCALDLSLGCYLHTDQQYFSSGLFGLE